MAADAPLHEATNRSCNKMPVLALHVNGEVISHLLLQGKHTRRFKNTLVAVVVGDGGVQTAEQQKKE